MKKQLYVVFVSVFMVLLLAACSGDSATSDTDESGNVQLTFFAPQGKAPMEENEFTLFIEDKFDVSLNWDVAPTDALTDRRQLLLASGDYPEVFLEGKFSSTDLLTYGSQGVFLPLNDLIEEHAPNITAMMDKSEVFREAITAPDGNIYALPRFNECYHCTYSQKYWMNEDWLNAVGMEMPKTTDDLYEVLKAFKTEDPNGNGEADEIPLTGAPDKYVWNGNIDAYLMNSFIYNDNDKYLLLENGKVDFAANKPAWRDGLSYMNKLYEEGLIDQAAFTQNDQAIGQLGNREGDEVVGSVTTALISYLVDTYDPEAERHKHWTIVPPLEGPEGVQLAGVEKGIAEFQFAITNKATEAQQVKAIEIANYLFSEEGSLYSEYGPSEGSGWKMAEAEEKNIKGEPAKYSYYNLPERDPNVVVNESWSLVGPKDLSNDFRDLFAEGQDPLTAEGYGTRLAQATEVYAPYAPEEYYPTGVYIRPDDTEAAAQITTAIQDYVESNLAQFIVGSKDIDKEWDAYVEGFEGLGLDQYLDIYQSAIEKE
ncbi:carbohydrate ABC transporter substrate-binding protein (CUT1 family) [Aureibacillus halotolerans]|uniref:Carbohydrate ABC transporter substrate-binding protein (CUT1 family) n=2 Tax=Aureibacillus halotolerans TaxID=1508390 RepID=A0A4R6UD29_9BACI|nr:carbohydrate ABC transporter substrate-binding protein (CUT1 family) [Aureibacillus halotolerans]